MKIIIDTRKYPKYFKPIICRIEMQCSIHRCMDRCNLNAYMRSILCPKYAKHSELILTMIKIPPMPGRVIKCPSKMYWKDHARRIPLINYLR